MFCFCNKSCPLGNVDWMEWWMDGCVDGQIDRWVGGWMGWWVNGWMHEWMVEMDCFSLFIEQRFPTLCFMMGTELSLGSQGSWDRWGLSLRGAFLRQLMWTSGTYLYLRADWWGKSWGKRTPCKEVQRSSCWRPRLPVVASGSSSRQPDLRWDGRRESLPAMCLEPALSHITVCSKHLYLAFSESLAFSTQGRYLYQQPLCVLLARMNSPSQGQ